MTDPITLAARVEALTGPRGHNALDVLCEVALFKPDASSKAIRANDAQTKVVYTNHDGSEHVCWAYDWTTGENRRATVAALRAQVQP